MRGVATGGDGQATTSQPSVGTYLDEQPITTVQGNLDVHLYDIARVEALAGPQGTLYGASSQAGTIRIITNKPDPSGFAAGYSLEGNFVDGDDTGYVAEGFVNFPISENAAHPPRRLDAARPRAGSTTSQPPGCTRATLRTPTTISWRTTRNSPRTTTTPLDTIGARAALRVNLGENWTVTPSSCTRRWSRKAPIIVTSGGITCGSGSATAFASAAQGVLGIQVGGALANCSVLESESVFSASDLPSALGALFLYLKGMASALRPKAGVGDRNENQADLEAALTYLKQSPTFRALWAQFQALPVKIVVDRGGVSEFDKNQPKQVTWDPDSGLIMAGGASSPAAALAHEIAHAIRYHTDYAGYMTEYRPEPSLEPDPFNPEHQINVYKTAVEENRVTAIEATIEQELGEPTRLRYLDGVNNEILIHRPNVQLLPRATRLR